MLLWRRLGAAPETQRGCPASDQFCLLRLDDEPGQARSAEIASVIFALLLLGHEDSGGVSRGLPHKERMGLSEEQSVSF